MKPVNVAIGTPYGARSDMWGCDKDASGQGIHTGVDFPAPEGTAVRAARPGVVRYVDYGPAFGSHQLAVFAADGTSDFYAHMTTRWVADGSHAVAGQRLGSVGAEGNVTGPHLHFERHAHGVGVTGWSCAIVRDPMPSVKWQPPDRNNEEFTVGYKDWAQADKDALAHDVAQRVLEGLLDVPMNAAPGKKGEALFQGVSLRDALKTVYRKVTGGK